MAASKALLVVSLLVISCQAFPEYRETGQKLVKINQHEKTKNVLMIMKKTAVSDGAAGSAPSGIPDAAGSAPSGIPDAAGSAPSVTPDARTHAQAEASAEEPKEEEHPGKGAPVVTVSHVGGQEHGVSVDGGCVNPAPDHLEVYYKFAKTLVTHRMFVLASSGYYANQASLVLTGEPYSEARANKACLRVMWENHRRRLQGYGHSSILSCTADDLTDITCFREQNRDAKLRITYVWSDGKANVLAIMCGNGHGSWAILSNEREIEPHTREAILQIVESYGFDPADVVDYVYTEEDCASSVQNQYREGHCIENPDDLETIPASETQAALEILRGGVYTPLSSYANAFATGMFIQGRPVKTVDDLTNVCVKDTWYDNGEIERQGFYNQDAFLECDVSNFNRMSCIPNEQKADEGSARIIYNRHINPIWTDGESYVLTYNCLSTRYKTWSLLSSSKEPVHREVKKLVLAKIADYGFDPNQAYEANYDNCAN